MNESNIDVICRLCLNNSFLHSNIFAGQTSDSNPTYEIINYAYDLQISADDGLPEYICENCYALVKAFQVYKTNAHKARSEIIRLKQEMVKREDGGYDVIHGGKGATDINEHHISGNPNGEGGIPVEVTMGINSDERNEHQVFVKQEDNSIDIGCSSKSETPVYHDTFGERPDYVVEGNGRIISFGGHFADDGSKAHDPNNQMPLDELDHGNVEAILGDDPDAGGEPSNACGSKERKKFKCHICNKYFKEKCGLMAHSVLHTGEKIFECVECLKRFKTKGSLLIHSRIHVAVKPYGCDVCWKRFSRKDTLTSHLVTHTNDRPYKCHLCEKRYTFKRALRRHLKVHNPT